MHTARKGPNRFSFLRGRTDADRDDEVRVVLMLVATLAQKCGPAVIVVDTKGKCAKTLTHDMVLASRPFISRRRPIWHVVLEINDAQRCFFLAVKNTLTAQGQRLAFTSGGERLALKCEAQPAAW